jgi:RNA polymerase sigma factor (sigma-70 family)
MSARAQARHSLFEAWVAAHRGIVVKIARSFAPAAADAADLQQEILLQLWISLDSFAAQSKPATWIYRVALNTALTWRRGTARRVRLLAPATEIETLAASASTPAECAHDREMLARLYTAIQAMPPSDRALVLLSLDGLAYREIAEITGLTENHVGVALTRARKRLTTLLQGVTDELE